ncbi:SLATT domain-containing protein, partial [Motilibacter deserti]
VGLSVASYAAFARYEHNVVSYLTTVNALTRLRQRWQATQGRPGADADYVRECERVISVETQGWMAEWRKTTTS